MDRRSWIAVALCVVFLLAYQPLLKLLKLDQYLYPPPARRATTSAPATGGSMTHDSLAARDSSAMTQPLSALSGAAKPGAAPSAGRTEKPAPPPVLAATPVTAPIASLERNYTLETPLYRATFTNRGARLLSVELREYLATRAPESAAHRASDHSPELAPRVVLAGGPSFGIDLGSGADLRSLASVAYAVTESTDAAGAVRTLRFTAEDGTGFAVVQTWRVRPDNYALDLSVEIRNVPDAMRVNDYTLTSRSWPLLTEANQHADETALKASSLVGTNIHRENPGALARGPKTFDGNVSWAAVQSRYFLGGVAILSGESRGVVASAEKRALTPEQVAMLGPDAKPDQSVLSSGMIVSLPGRDLPVHRFVVYFGPAEYFRLSALKLHFERAVDMGWNWILPFSKAMLQLLKWLYALAKNYGVAILLLATLVRLVLHPLNVTSMKSMRAMQRLQPELERIKDKYKNDAQAQNTATLALYKENKVNPASGCLPMVLQMPVFFALYSVLFNAIELRRAPFVAWMQDLSAPDLAFTVGPFPIRLLPLLMAGSGLLQQAVTPSDPRQRPTMYMMNVVMVVFFYNLPSGLVLYWTVMNLLTALQQWLVLRQDGGAVVATAPAAAAGKRR